MNLKPEKHLNYATGFAVPIQRGAIIATCAAFCVCTLILAGCGKSESSASNAPAASAGGVDVSKVREAFKSASPSLRFAMDEPLRIAQSGGYADALPSLRKLAGHPSLNAEQKQALDDLIRQLQTLAAQPRTR